MLSLLAEASHVNYRIYKIAPDAYALAPNNGVPRQMQDYCTLNRAGVVTFMTTCQLQVRGASELALRDILARLESVLDEPGLGFKGIISFDSTTEVASPSDDSPPAMAARLHLPG